MKRLLFAIGIVTLAFAGALGLILLLVNLILTLGNLQGIAVFAGIVFVLCVIMAWLGLQEWSRE